MSSQCIVAVFENIRKASIGMEVLNKAGYDSQHVSFVSRSDAPELKELQQAEGPSVTPTASHSVQEPGGNVAAKGTGFGAAIGGAVAAPIAISTLVFPLFVVGPLVGAGLGAALGGLFDAGSDSGAHRIAEPSYEESLRDGGALIIVTGTEHELVKAKASLQTCGPVSLKVREIGSPKPS